MIHTPGAKGLAVHRSEVWKRFGTSSMLALSLLPQPLMTEGQGRGIVVHLSGRFEVDTTNHQETAVCESR